MGVVFRSLKPKPMPHIFLSSTPEDLVQALDEENRSMEEREAQRQAEGLGLRYVNLHNFPLDLNVLSLFTAEEAKTAESLPFFREGLDLRIATTNPENSLLKDKIAQLPKYKISLYFVSKSSFQKTWQYYNKVLRPKAPGQTGVRADDQLDYAAALKNLQQPEVQGQIAATELLADLLGAAVAQEASDVHFEPEQHLLKVRFRLDGVLQDVIHLRPQLQQKIVARLKILAKLKLNVTNVPQDGRLTFYFGQRPVDVRVSILPSGYGEAIVLRLLGIGATNLKLGQLGLQGLAYKIIEQQLAKPNGMVITTGPTGSGKTTTLYAFLNELNQPGVKIITLEDPIEYRLEGIQQTPIDYRVDFSFVKGLRAILRQDPDIVMVGEIRDGETADTALQAALTGHVVLSTLHTNDASGAIPRLVTMGVKPFIIAPAVNAIIAQRLVRRLCPACKQPANLSAILKKQVTSALRDIPPAAAVELPKELQFFHSPGCSVCHSVGYQGRIGIYEVMAVNDKIKELILNNASSAQLKTQAYNDGMVTLLQDGLLKALAGVTDVEEVFRVAGVML